MASVSTDTIRKAHYEHLLQGRIARDERSADMLDLIFDTITTDTIIAYNYGSIRTNIIVPIMSADTESISSIIESKRGPVNNNIKEVNEIVKNLK